MRVRSILAWALCAVAVAAVVASIVQYAEASSATVTLAQRNGRLTFAVVDGRGFDTDATERGTGLQVMADRLEAIGGELTIETSVGQGTSVIGRIPIRGGLL